MNYFITVNHYLNVSKLLKPWNFYSETGHHLLYKEILRKCSLQAGWRKSISQQSTSGEYLILLIVEVEYNTVQSITMSSECSDRKSKSGSQQMCSASSSTYTAFDAADQNKTVPKYLTWTLNRLLTFRKRSFSFNEPSSRTSKTNLLNKKSVLWCDNAMVV